jgi:hypothetical protein
MRPAGIAGRFRATFVFFFDPHQSKDHGRTAGTVITVF